MQRLYADKTGKDDNLARYAASAALATGQSDAKHFHGQGLIITGEVSVKDPTVTRIDLNREIPNVFLTSCLDVTHWQVVDADTRKAAPLPSKRLTKYVILSTVEQRPEGWQVIKDVPQQGQPC